MSQQSLSVCVFCASRPGNDPIFQSAATRLGEGLAEIGARLVYGAGGVGLMGAVATAVQAAGGTTLGVIPTHLIDREQGKRDLSAFILTETMHERKKVMFQNSDVIAVLPGGPGTLEEALEVLTWRQIGLHTKPIYVLNIGGYWDPLQALISNTVSHAFAEETVLEAIHFVASPEEMLAELGG